MLKSVVISGGGTGGHIFPALAIANEIKKRYSDCNINFVGALNRMEMEKVPAVGYHIIGLPISGLKRKIFSLDNLKLPFKVLKSIMIAMQFLKKNNPQVVIGVGGYASSATLFAAYLLRIPTLIQEQNGYAGLTNKILSKIAFKICVAYNGMEKFFPKKKLIFTGNPVRQDIVESVNLNQNEAKEKLGFNSQSTLLLVIGGSLGAKTINQAIENCIEKLAENEIQILWQTGKNFSSQKHHLKNVKIVEFIQEMNWCYAASDIVVSRAGALSVSELCIVKKPCILIPSPNVTDDHQTKNALQLSQKNACVLLKDSEAKDKLGIEILNLKNDKFKQENLINNISKLAKTNSVELIVNEIEKISK